MYPGDRRVVTLVGNEVASVLGDRLVGIVVDLAPATMASIRRGVGEAANHARLGLATLAEEDHVVPARIAFSRSGMTVSS